MKTVFGYVRVSTARQGEHGVSLQEQRDAILRYAERNSLDIVEWFEERETAAKRGRPGFGRMLKGLREGRTTGVIIHKIDRSARNLKDWSDLGELIDQGTDVHFANESLDLHTRGGRLSADIQAVVAADYIRNLREETRKGFYGRIKQGLYPLPAPLGYLNAGRGKLKTLDPAKAPLVRKAFELYATGEYNLDELVIELWRRGLRNQHSGKLTRNGLSVLLNKPFYIGLIRLHRTGEVFPGGHEPLISKSLFDRVQRILRGKVHAKVLRHEFLFRRLFTCQTCRYSLSGERQKGWIYYRCHTRTCPTTAIRQDAAENVVLEQLAPLTFTPEEKAYLAQKVAHLRNSWTEERERQRPALALRLKQLDDRLNRLTDAYIDRLIEKDLFETRKTALLLERKGLEEQLKALNDNEVAVPDRLTKFLELAGSAYCLYKAGIDHEKRDLLQIVTSNRQVGVKNLDLRLSLPFSEVANRQKNTNGAATGI